MSVTIRGRVPSAWNDQTAAHLTERLRALETALAGGTPTFISPAAPPTGPSVIVVPPPAGGGGGVTDHGALTGLLDDDHPQYTKRGDPISVHVHGSQDVVGIEQRFAERLERRPPATHQHGAQDIVGLQERLGVQAHSHRMGDVADLRPDDLQLVLAGQVFGA